MKEFRLIVSSSDILILRDNIRKRERFSSENQNEALNLAEGEGLTRAGAQLCRSIIMAGASWNMQGIVLAAPNQIATDTQAGLYN